jgi:hypothetical protein
LRLILVAVLISCLLGCRGIGATKERTKSSKVFLTVTIESYTENAEPVRSPYAAYPFLHVSVLRVDQPEKYRGRRLRVTHRGDYPPKGYWKNVGGTFEAVIDKFYLKEAYGDIDSFRFGRLLNTLGPYTGYQTGIIIE